MTQDIANSENIPLAGITRLVERANSLISGVSPLWLTQAVLRLALATPFWKSGILKWDGFLQINDTAIELFTSEFKLHLPGGPYDFPQPALFAFASGTAEIILPILLVLGIGTRAAGLGLLVMTGVVQLTEPGGWPIHLTWAAMAIAIMGYGPGPISLDRLLQALFRAAPGRG